jgi:phage shock protein C
MTCGSHDGTVGRIGSAPRGTLRPEERTVNAIHTQFARQGLVRTQDDRLLGGVCSGLARRTGAEPWAIRALFAVALVVIPGSQLIVYPLLWVLMPDEHAVAAGHQTV